MNATSTTSVNFAPKHLSGIDVIDDAWGGLYRGGSYLVYGRAASGRGLLTLMFARTGAAFGESTLLVSPDRQKDLMIQAASIGFNLREAHDSGIVRLLRVPPLMNLQNMGDDGVSKALWDLVTLIRRHRPTRLIMNDFMPFVAFRSFDRFRNEFIQFLEQIDSLDTTTLLVMPEPANPQSTRVIEFMASQMTGSIHIELAEDGASTTKRRISLIPHIGHIKRQVVDYWDLEDLIQTGPATAPAAHPAPTQFADAPPPTSSTRRPGVPPIIPIPGFPQASQQQPQTPQAPYQAPPQPAAPFSGQPGAPPQGGPQAPGYGRPAAPANEPQQPPMERGVHPPYEPQQPPMERGVQPPYEPQQPPMERGVQPPYEPQQPPVNQGVQPPYGPAPRQPEGPYAPHPQAPQRPEPYAPAPQEPSQKPYETRPSESFQQSEQVFSRTPRFGEGYPPAPEAPKESSFQAPAPAPEPPKPYAPQTPPEVFYPQPPAEVEYTNREAFRLRLQQQFANREVMHQPFLLLALRMDRSAQSTARPFDFDFLMDLVGEELRTQDDMLANIDLERLVVYLSDSRPEEAQSFFTRLKDRLRQESPTQADHLLHSVSAIVVPDGRPFQNAAEFLTYALDEA